jgi:hypothetical protein
MIKLKYKLFNLILIPKILLVLAPIVHIESGNELTLIQFYVIFI